MRPMDETTATFVRILCLFKNLGFNVSLCEFPYFFLTPKVRTKQWWHIYVSSGNWNIHSSFLLGSCQLRCEAMTSSKRPVSVVARFQHASPVWGLLETLQDLPLATTSGPVRWRGLKYQSCKVMGAWKHRSTPTKINLDPEKGTFISQPSIFRWTRLLHFETSKVHSKRSQIKKQKPTNLIQRTQEFWNF